LKSLNELKANSEGVVASIDGDARYLSRITSIGITPGCHIKVLKNDRNRPMLVFMRYTMVALNKEESRNIKIETRDN
jgi:ferrous iron transport protein A